MRTAAVDEQALRGRWDRLCRGLPSPQRCGQAFDRLWAAYTAPDRHYHDIQHVADCLQELDGVRHLALHPDAIEAAIWFHDIVYDGRRIDNEERSADAARSTLTELGCEPGFVDEIVRLILLTRHEREPDTTDGRLMVDIDLASLALPPEQFDDNGRRIRQEFGHVPDADFRRGRNQMLGRFLERPRVYYTDVFHGQYEQAARQNLMRVIAAG